MVFCSFNNFNLILSLSFTHDYNNCIDYFRFTAVFPLNNSLCNAL